MKARPSRVVSLNRARYSSLHKLANNPYFDRKQLEIEITKSLRSIDWQVISMISATQDVETNFDKEKPTRVLIIEDEKDLRLDMTDVLSMENFEVITAPDGAHGIAAALSKEPDVILCDIMMPHINGYQVLKAIRSHASTRLIPFIFMTAKAERSDMRAGMELGADDYITKPFSYDEMLQAIETQMQKVKAVAESQQQRVQQIHDLVTRSLPHEFRTPLTTILGYSEIMLQDAGKKGNTEEASRASHILNAGKKLHRMVENYLLFTELSTIDVDIETVAAHLRNSQYGWAVDIQAECKNLAADYGRKQDLVFNMMEEDSPLPEPVLTKMLHELLRNACAFSKQGTPIKITSGFDTRGRYEVSVTDYGTGMSESEIQQIGAYIQFNRNIYEQQGIGLGLAIVQHLAKMFDGALHINSTPGKGTTVSISV